MEWALPSKGSALAHSFSHSRRGQVLEHNALRRVLEHGASDLALSREHEGRTPETVSEGAQVAAAGVDSSSLLPLTAMDQVPCSRHRHTCKNSMITQTRGRWSSGSHADLLTWQGCCCCQEWWHAAVMDIELRSICPVSCNSYRHKQNPTLRL